MHTCIFLDILRSAAITSNMDDKFTFKDRFMTIVSLSEEAE